MNDKIDYDKAFEGCTSNLDAPLMGRIITPTCYQCENQVEDKDPFKPNTCKVFGKLPEKYAYDDKEECPHKVIAKKFSWPLTEEQRKALLAKRAYYSEHPEEALKAMVKKDDGVVIVTPPKKQTTIESSWKDEFAPHILARGTKYFEEGHVSRIQRVNNTYIADVEGTYEYEVEITIEDGGIKGMLCNCPYAETDNCKHMAAVLCALETEDIAIEELTLAPTPPIVSHIPLEMPWLEAIDNLPEETVRKELLKRADREDWLKERLAVLYLGGLPEGQIQNWKADLQEIASHYINRRGWISDEDAWEFTDDLGDFLNDHLPLLLEVNAVMDAFYLVWIVMETALEWHVDNSDDDVDDLLEGCEERLRKVYSMATDEQREQMMQWYQEHRNPEWPGSVENMDHIFQSLTLANIPVKGNRVIKYVYEAPCFLFDGKWITFPKRGDLYYDFVEDTAVYKEVEPIVEAMIMEILGERYDYFGACHAIWHHKKRLLMEKYGIEWFTPVELNPCVDFD